MLHPATPLASPLEVLRRRVRAGEAMLEVSWAPSCSPSSCTCSASPSSSYPCVLPATFVGCVPTTDFASAFAEVYRLFEEKLAAKEEAKKKPKTRKKKGKENEEGEEDKAKKPAKKKVSKAQPKISNFLQEKAEEKVEENVSLERPKNIVFKKLVSKDEEFNNKVISSRYRTPEAKVMEEEEEVRKVENQESFDYRPRMAERERAGEEELEEEEREGEDSLAMYVDSGEDSDLSGIIDAIVGAKVGRDLATSLHLMNISGAPSTPSYLTSRPRLPSHLAPSTPSYIVAPSSLMTSTPNTMATASPCLKGARGRQVKGARARQVEQVKASDVFDLSDSFMAMDVEDNAAKKKEAVEEASEAADDAKEEAKTAADSFDEFDLASQETPLAVRIQRRMNL